MNMTLPEVEALLELAGRAAKSGAEQLWYQTLLFRWNSSQRAQQDEEQEEEDQVKQEEEGEGQSA